MSVPYSDTYRWGNFKKAPEGVKVEKHSPVKVLKASSADLVIQNMATQIFKEFPARCEQFVRDAARLLLKTPVRCIYRPIVEGCIWRQRERTIINGKLTFYSFVQLASIPGNFLAFLMAFGTPPFAWEKEELLQDLDASWTQDIDERRAKLEALKEEGLKHAAEETEFLAYENWIRKIDVLPKPLEGLVL